MNSKETADGRDRIVDMDVKARSVTLRNPKGDSSEPPKTFTFDAVYDSTCEQAQIFEETAKPIVDSVISGYNGASFFLGPFQNDPYLHLCDILCLLFVCTLH